MSTVLAVVIAVAIAAVGVVVGYLIRTSSSGHARTPHTAPQHSDSAVVARRSAPRPPTAPMAGPPGPAAAPAPGDDRLVQALIGVYDTSSEEAVRGYVVGQLGALGIVPVSPEPGSRFTPEAQRCVSTEAAPGVADGTLIRTDRPGWQGPGGTIRMPDVTVVAADRS